MGLAVAASFDNAVRPETRSSLLLPAVELLAVLGLVEIDLWYLRGTDNPLLHAALFATIGMLIWLSTQRRQRMGLPIQKVSTAARAWAESLLLIASTTLILFATAWLFRDRDEGFRLFFRQQPLAGWLLWIATRVAGAVLQQLGLQLLIGPVCQEIVRPRVVAVGVAGLFFGILHLPHPILFVISAVIGSLWVWLYSRSGRLLPLIVCHAVLSILAAGSLPKTVISDMDIGPFALGQMINPRYLCTEDVREALELVKTEAYYKRQGSTPQAFIAGVHRDFLGREPTADELGKWLIELSENSRAKTALSIFKSKAFATVHVRAIARRMSIDQTDDLAQKNLGNPQRR